MKIVKQITGAYYSIFIYLFCLTISLCVLHQARCADLLPIPPKPMADQHNFLRAAIMVNLGELPDIDYKLSPGYTFFLAILIKLSNYKVVIARILQACICALIPVIIYKLCILSDLGKTTGFYASLIYCFYGPAILISLSFLRASILSLCFICYVFYLIKGYKYKKNLYFIFSGLFIGLCVLGRENFIPIIGFPLFLLFFSKIRIGISWRNVINYIAGALLVLLPILLMNYIRFNEFAIIPGNLSYVLSFYHSNNSNAELNSLIISALKNVPRQIMMFVSSYEKQNSLSFYAHRDIIQILWMLFVPFNLLLSLSILAVWKNRKVYVVNILALLIFAYFATIIYFDMFYRFRIPCVPLLCVMSGLGIKEILTEDNRLKRILLIVFVASVFFITYDSPDRLRDIGQRKAVVEILLCNREYYRAEKYLEKLESQNIHLKEYWQKLIYELLRNGQCNRANIVMGIYEKYKNRDKQ